MNKKNISQIFNNYLQLSQRDDIHYDACHIWEQTACFQKKFNLDASDFAVMLKDVYDTSGDLVDDIFCPFRGLVYMAMYDGESETIRDMFRELYKDDQGNLSLRQEKILKFIRISNRLLENHHPGSYLFRNDQHSVMAYLWLYDPEHNYQYKQSEVEYLAYAAEFHEEWSRSEDFKLDVYYKFCDSLLHEIEENDELAAAYKEVLVDSDFSAVAQKHIFLYDFAHSADVYQLYNGITIRKHSLDERKKYRLNKEKAQELAVELAKTEMDVLMEQEAVRKIMDMIGRDENVRHKTYGEGVVSEADENYIKINFKDMTKKFQLTSAIGNGFLVFDVPGFSEFFDKYGKVLKNKSVNLHRMTGIQGMLDPYMQYL